MAYYRGIKYNPKATTVSKNKPMAGGVYRGVTWTKLTQSNSQPAVSGIYRGVAWQSSDDS